MKANTRLVLCIFIIVGSAAYGLVLSESPRFAESIALGYIAVLLTIIVALNLFKGKTHRGNNGRGSSESSEPRIHRVPNGS